MAVETIELSGQNSELAKEEWVGPKLVPQVP